MERDNNKKRKSNEDYGAADESGGNEGTVSSKDDRYDGDDVGEMGWGRKKEVIEDELKKQMAKLNIGLKAARSNNPSNDDYKYDEGNEKSKWRVIDRFATKTAT